MKFWDELIVSNGDCMSEGEILDPINPLAQLHHQLLLPRFNVFQHNDLAAVKSVII